MKIIQQGARNRDSSQWPRWMLKNRERRAAQLRFLHSGEVQNTCLDPKGNGSCLVARQIKE